MTRRPDPHRPAEDLRLRAERERRRVRAHAAAAAMYGIERRHRTDFAATFRDCGTAEFVELMIGLAREIRSAAPAQAIERLGLGLTAAEGAGVAGRPDLEAAAALAMAELGAAYRLGGNLAESERTLLEARRRAASLADDELLFTVDLYRVLVAVLGDDTEALRALVGQAMTTARRVSPHAQGRLYLAAGACLDGSRNPIEALDHFETGLRLIDARQQPLSAAVGLGNVGAELIRLGKLTDGRYFLRRALALFQRFGSPVNRAHTLWLASWADWMDGDRDQAIDNIEIAAHRLASLGQPILTGTVFLDLSRFLARSGRWTQVERAAVKSLEILGACDLPRDLSIAETVIREAGRTRRRSVERVEEAVESLL